MAACAKYFHFSTSAHCIFTPFLSFDSISSANGSQQLLRPAPTPAIEMAGFEPLNFDYSWPVLTDR